MIRQFFILLIALIWLSTIKQNLSVAAYELLITDVSLDNSSKYVQTDLKIISGRQLNLTMNITNTINHITVHFDFSVTSFDSPANTKYRSILKRTIDICKLLSDPIYEPLLYHMWQDARKDKRNNLAARCPFQPDSYYLRNFVIDTSKIPPMVPSVKFFTKMKYDVTFGSEKETLEYRIYGTLDNGAGKLLKSLG